MSEVIPKELIERHEYYKRQWWGGLIEQCCAMESILKEGTFRAEGYENFTDFCRGSGFSHTKGYQYAAAAPVLREFVNSGIPENILALEHLAPISKMPNPKQQVKVYQLACSKAPKSPSGLPRVTRKHVAAVAREYFNWLPENEFKAKNRPQPSRAEVMATVKGRIDSANLLLAGIGITADEAYEVFGNPAEWPGYLKAYAFLKDLYENVG